MDSLSFNFNMDDGRPLFNAASEKQSSTTNGSFTPTERPAGSSSTDSVFSPFAAPFQSRLNCSNLLSLFTQPEPSTDAASPTVDVEDVFVNIRHNGDSLFNDADHSSNNSYYMGGNRLNPTAINDSNIWGDGICASAARNGDMIDTFDFLIKSISSANNYVSMLTREQLTILRSVRPSLLYELLQEICKIRSDRRMRRALPNECAFCKNNGENEESYSSHGLKDWRGRVLCPVLRAFRCPRCGATGDRAHTIKYCPENVDNGVDRASSLFSRRRSSSSLNFGSNRGSTYSVLNTPAPSPSPSTSAFNHTSPWSNFGMN